MRKLLLVSPYFVPSNLAGVHRARLLGNALPEFGWEPIVITVDPQFYEEAVDPASIHLLRAGLHVERVRAFSPVILRPLGIGDVSLRAYLQLKQCIRRLVGEAAPDLIFVTVLPGYTSMLGSWAKRRFKLPFVLDYQDPWVPARAGRMRSRKAQLAEAIARRLEPKAISNVDAVTAVSDQTLDTLRQRGLLPPSIPTEIIPIGADENDHDAAAQHGRSLIDPDEDAVQIAYLGTLTERMLPAFRTFLAAIVSARDMTSRRVIVHAIGSSGRPDGDDQHNLRSLPESAALGGDFRMHAPRISYLDALRTMQHSDLLVLIGSTDSHYTASKLFPYWLSGKPIVGLFHRSSTIVELAQELGGVRLILYGDSGPEIVREDVTRLLAGILRGDVAAPPRNERNFRGYSAAGIAARFASVFDRVIARCG